MDIRTTLYATRGAVSAVAAAIGVSSAAVSQWRRRGIPTKRMPAIEEALRVHLASIGVTEVNAAAAEDSNHDRANTQ